MKLNPFATCEHQEGLYRPDEFPSEEEKQNIEKETLFILDNLREKPASLLVPVDVACIAKSQYEASVFLVPPQTSFQGIFDPNHDCHVIAINESLSNRDRRFVLAHELGHIHLHTQHLIAYDEISKWKQAHKDNANIQSRKQDREANHFAAFLLMPRKEVGILSSNFWNSKAPFVIKLSDLECQTYTFTPENILRYRIFLDFKKHIADQFNVSLETSRIQLMALGLFDIVPERSNLQFRSRKNALASMHKSILGEYNEYENTDNKMNQYKEFRWDKHLPPQQGSSHDSTQPDLFK